METYGCCEHETIKEWITFTNLIQNAQFIPVREKKTLYRLSLQIILEIIRPDLRRSDSLRVLNMQKNRIIKDVSIFISGTGICLY